MRRGFTRLGTWRRCTSNTAGHVTTGACPTHGGVGKDGVANTVPGLSFLGLRQCGHETAWAATVGAGPGHDGIGKGTSRCCRQVPGATAAVEMPDAVGARSVTHQHVHKAVEERDISIKGTGRNH